MEHSPDLLWLLVRRNNKFYQNRYHVRLSNDPFNNTGLYTKRHTGFIQNKAAVVKVKGEKKLALTTKDVTPETVRKPRKMFKCEEFDPNGKASLVSKAGATVRPDLADCIYRRARKLGVTLRRQAKVREARKARSAKRTYKHKRVRARKETKK